jgi:hypothetical protein
MPAVQVKKYLKLLQSGNSTRGKRTMGGGKSNDLMHLTVDSP